MSAADSAVPAAASPGLPSGGLPLTAFEEYMLADDRPSHPMMIVLRLEFSGGPPPATLASAFDDTLRTEPLLTARVKRGLFGRPRWVDGVIPRLERRAAGGAAEDHAEPVRRIDPFAGPLLHATVGEWREGWSIQISVHHAACDGLGILGFVERWLAMAHGAAAQARGTRAAAGISSRGRVAGSWREFVHMLPRLRVGLQGIRQFMSRRVRRLDERMSAPTAGPSAEAWQPTVTTATLTVAETQALDRYARSVGVNVNDLLVAAWMAATDALRTTAADPDRDDWIRIGVPMSLRTKSDYALPAVNRVSMVFLDRRVGDLADRSSLFRGIRDEMELIRSHALGHIFPLSLEVGRLLPGGLRRIANRPEPQCSAVLSNLGRCFHRSPLTAEHGALAVGTSRLVSWWIVPPVRPGTAVALATHETAGRRALALQVDPACLTADDAGRLLDRTIAELRDAIA
jgi:hypothetical protein